MTTIVDILVEGTCTASPDENLIDVLKAEGFEQRIRPYAKRIKRDKRLISGGPTVALVQSNGDSYVLDAGDDREVLEESLSELPNGTRDKIRSVYVTHLHPDHIACADVFAKGQADILVDQNDPWVCMLEREPILNSIDINAESYKFFRDHFKPYRENGFTADNLTLYGSNDHPGKPKGLRLIDTPGHHHVHKSFAIEDSQGIIVINHETGKELKTTKLVFAGDAICDPRYLGRFMREDLTGNYGRNIPWQQWIYPTEGIRNRMDWKGIESARKLIGELKEGGIMLFGHGGYLQR